MRLYETLYLINPNLADEDYKSVLDKFSNFVGKNNGVVIKVDEWGKKDLAYEVKKFDKGYYVLLQYCGQADLITELRRSLKLDDRVLRYQTIKISDTADPEALKAKAEQGEAKALEESETAEEISPGQLGDISENQEGEDGV